jgi:sodium/potassium-transporting ATPase subunit alpha
MTAEQAKEVMAANKQSNPKNNSISQLRALAGLCNAGSFDASTMNLPLHERIIHGDATDQAILRFSESLGEVAELRRWWNTKYELAFNSKNKYMIKAFTLAHQSGVALALPSDTASVFGPGDV